MKLGVEGPVHMKPQCGFLVVNTYYVLSILLFTLLPLTLTKFYELAVLSFYK